MLALINFDQREVIVLGLFLWKNKIRMCDIDTENPLICQSWELSL